MQMILPHCILRSVPLLPLYPIFFGFVLEQHAMKLI
uniref:Uncharacterized protein n=1 Tax=Parascaris equorum TaxID=6256 RepID=A0A914S2V3_PAREQ